jgi:flagellar protein FliL
MADDAPEQDEGPKKKGVKPLLLGLALLVVGGGAGFGLVAMGLVGGGGGHEEAEAPVHPIDDVAFVPVDPLIISVGPASRQRHLRFQAQLEVTPGREADVTKMLPRVADILNGYLRAVDMADIENPASLVKLRAQMLRRIQIVVGEGLVSDLLVSEFVLN